MKTQLLATFTTKVYLDGIVDKIKTTYPIVFDKIYVLQNEESLKENNDVDTFCEPIWTWKKI